LSEPGERSPIVLDTSVAVKFYVPRRDVNKPANC